MTQPTTLPCTCGGTLILRGSTWGCDRMTDDPATHGDHAFALICPRCGPKPLSEFTYAGDVTCYARLTAFNDKGELLIEELQPEFDAGHENVRIFHDCGAYYVEALPAIAP